MTHTVVIAFPLSSHLFRLTTIVRHSTSGARQLGANRKPFHLHSLSTLISSSPPLPFRLQTTTIVRVRAWVPVGATLGPGAERTWERSISTAGAPVGHLLQLYSFRLSSPRTSLTFRPPTQDDSEQIEDYSALSTATRLTQPLPNLAL